MNKIYQIIAIAFLVGTINVLVEAKANEDLTEKGSLVPSTEQKHAAEDLPQTLSGKVLSRVKRCGGGGGGGDDDGDANRSRRSRRSRRARRRAKKAKKNASTTTTVTRQVIQNGQVVSSTTQPACAQPVAPQQPVIIQQQPPQVIQQQQPAQVVQQQQPPQVVQQQPAQIVQQANTAPPQQLINIPIPSVSASGSVKLG